MKLLPSPWVGRLGFRRLLVWSLPLPFLLTASFSSLQAQDDLTLPELDGQYRSALLEYDAAYQALEVLESRYEGASQELNAALAAGDEAARDLAYGEIYRISSMRRQAQRRVDDKVKELREARGRLRAANVEYLEELLAQYAAVSDPVVQENLWVLMEDTRHRINELLNLEDPPATLEPMPDINVEPRDGPAELRTKASILEITASQYDSTYAYYGRRLEDLRRDQRALRGLDDFLADANRFDDPTVPVGPPTTRTTTPPDQVPPPTVADSLGTQGEFLTVEQRIQALEMLQQEIAQRIELIRIRAAEFRRQAGGEWAWQ